LHDLPGKKIIAGIVALLVIATVSFAVFYPDTTTTENNRSSLNENLSTALVSRASDQDSDGDGLKDWEEALWKSDPKNPDTDGDGTPDGEEVAMDRDPAAAGPNDAFSLNLAEAEAAIDANPDLSETEKFSRKLFQQYLALKQSGDDLDESAQQRLVISALGTLPPPEEVPLLSATDLHITPDSSERSLRQYANELGTIYDSYGSVGTANELDILYASLKANDLRKIQDLDVIVASYAALADQMKTMRVPQEIADIHLALLNSSLRISASTDGMRRVYEDPVLALSSLQAYLSDVQDLIDAINHMFAFFQEQKIVFAENEPAFTFVKNFSFLMQ
jgi:hypothetical protein